MNVHIEIQLEVGDRNSDIKFAERERIKNHILNFFMSNYFQEKHGCELGLLIWREVQKDLTSYLQKFSSSFVNRNLSVTSLSISFNQGPRINIYLSDSI